MYCLKLTKNEKKTLKLLISNARISDSEIAKQLNISSQAVGKIRRKLEETVINKYTIEVNYAKLNIQTFAIGIGKMTPQGMDKGELEIEQHLLENPHIMNIYRIPRGATTHILIYGFQDLNELDSFFHSKEYYKKINKYIETNELYTFSHNSLIKRNPEQLLHKAIDALGSKLAEEKIVALENFKRNL